MLREVKSSFQDFMLNSLNTDFFGVINNLGEFYDIEKIPLDTIKI